MNREQRLLLATCAAAVALCALAVADFVVGGPLVRHAGRLAAWFAAHQSPRRSTVAHAVAWVGNAFTLAGLVVVASGVLLWRRRPAVALALCAAALGAEVAAAGLKVVFHHRHPSGVDVDLLPSGHAAGSAAVYGSLLYLAVRSRSAVARVVALVLFVALVSAISAARLYVAAHHVSDIAVGATLGIAAAGFALLVALPRDHVRSRR